MHKLFEHCKEVEPIKPKTNKIAFLSSKNCPILANTCVQQNLGPNFPPPKKKKILIQNGSIMQQIETNLSQ